MALAGWGRAGLHGPQTGREEEQSATCRATATVRVGRAEKGKGGRDAERLELEK